MDPFEQGGGNPDDSHFTINRSSIHEIEKVNQAVELRELDICVYDQGTLEKGILSQVDKALKGSEDDFEENCDDDSGQPVMAEDDAVSSLQVDQLQRSIPIEERNSLGEFERYFKQQAELDKAKKKKRDAAPTKQKVATRDEKLSKKPKKRIPKLIDMSPSKSSGQKKRDELGTAKNIKHSYSTSPGKQPGEVSYVYLNKESDSEYLPSEDSTGYSSDGVSGKAKQKKLLKPRKKMKSTGRQRGHKVKPQNPNTSDSEWDSSEDERPSRKSKKELDDGDVDVYDRRMEAYSKQQDASPLGDECHDLTGGFTCPKYIWDKLYPYQQEGVKWLWGLDGLKCGGILGDEMGLGKTIQIIAYLAGLRVSRLEDSETNYVGLGPTLIVCPTTVMHQWVREFHTWFPPLRVAILHDSGTYTGRDRGQLVRSLHARKSGIIVTSYKGLVKNKEAILSRRWHYVILDEGHKIRNPEAQVTLVAKELDTPHRLILSGSPLQNNLRELWSLFDFIFPGKLGTLPVFMSTMAVPITQGGYTNASETQVLTAFKCATIVKDTITPYLLRRMKGDVGASASLPAKTEQVLFCRLTDEQRRVYKAYVDTICLDTMVHRGKAGLFVALITLRKICNHPDLYTGGPKANFQLTMDVNCNKNDRFGHPQRSGKLIVIETLLRIWKVQGHRVLLFTQGKKMLTILEDFISRCGYKYLKLDGMTCISSRQPLIDKFNKDTSYFIMLLTTRVGGLGVNLTGANRVVIYDPDWNPAIDTQARERAWRIGQKNDVTIYRLVTAGTIEEKIYHRQIYKQFLSNKVLTNPKQRRFFKSNDLMELFSLSETIKGGTTETAAIFAGTGSEVKLDGKLPPPHRYNPRKVAVAPQVTFSERKIEEMKRLAHFLSQRVATANRTDKAGCSRDQCTVGSMEGSSMESCSIYGPDGNLLQGISLGPDTLKMEVVDENTVVHEKEKDCDCSCKSITDMEQLGTDNGNLATLPSDNWKELASHSSKDEESINNDVSTCNTVSEEISCHLNPNNDNCNSNLVEPGVSKTCSPGKEFSPQKEVGRVKRSKKRRSSELEMVEEFAEFEGQKVPHLVKWKVDKGGKKRKKNRQEKGEQGNRKCDIAKQEYMSQDDYVLHKLFSKTGIETAMRHDTIMEGGPNDYAIVEAEADRVAQDAVRALRESRAQVPTFRRATFKFSLKKKLLNDKQDSTECLMEVIKKRELNLDSSVTEKSLLGEVVTWLNNQGGTASTAQLVEQFSPKVGTGQSPLFKSLLKNIATFYRAPDNIGYWTIKDEFK